MAAPIQSLEFSPVRLCKTPYIIVCLGVAKELKPKYVVVILSMRYISTDRSVIRFYNQSAIYKWERRNRGAGFGEGVY